MLDNQSTNYIIDINERNFKLQNITKKATRNINIKVSRFGNSRFVPHSVYLIKR